MLNRLYIFTLATLLLFVSVFIPQATYATTTISIVSPTSGSTVTGTSFAVTGTATANRIIAVTVNGTSAGTTTSDGSGNWTLNVTGQTAGAKTIAATASTQFLYTNVLNVGDFSASRMSIINTLTGTEESSFSIFGAGAFPITWKPNPAFTKAYGVAPYLNSATVWDMNLVTGAVTTFTLPGTTPRGASVAYSADGSKVYITDNANTTVHIYNTSNNVEIGSGLLIGAAPHSNAYRPGHNEVWVDNSSDNSLAVISTISDTVIHTYAVAGSPNGLIFSPDGETAYVGIGSALAVVNADTGTTTGTISGSAVPELLIISSDGSTVYASHPPSNTVDVYNTVSATLTATITVGTGPWGMALNEANSRLYVAKPHLFGSLNGTTISVINTSSNAVVDTLTPGGGAPFFIWAAPTESSSATANITLTSSSSSSSSSTSSASSGESKPNCDAQGGLASPELFQVDIKGTDATLHMKPPAGTFDKFFISYGTKANAEGYGVEYAQGKAPGAVTYTIKGLRPNTSYYFKVRAGNGCRPGPWSPSVTAKSKTFKNTQLSLFHPDWVLGIWKKINMKVSQVFNKKQTPQKKQSPQKKPSLLK